MGKRIDETVGLLRDIDAKGVWGNHDIGLCFDVVDEVRERFSPAVLDFMRGLLPRLEIDGSLFTHVEPWLDPNTIEDIWYFEGPPDTAEKLARSFGAVPNRVMFIGHFHRWLIGTADGVVSWRGEEPINLGNSDPHLVVVKMPCGAVTVRCSTRQQVN